VVLYRGLLVAVLSALVALVPLPATGSGAAPPVPPGIPGLPPIPGVHLPKPDQKAVFDVVVEGKATDINHSQLSGTTSTCLVTEDGHVSETDTYLRGKDVKLEFARFGKTLVLKRNRGGQLGDVSLAVKATVHRTATGGTSYSPASPPLPCGVPPTDLSKDKDCGKNLPVAGSALVLGWKGGAVSLAVSPNTVLKSFVNDTCGDDPQTGITDAVRWSWPQPIALSTAPLPKKWIFDDRRRTIILHLRSSDVMPTKSLRHVAFGELNGTVTDQGSNTATVRLIRQPG
jgi:hypothetical protein